MKHIFLLSILIIFFGCSTSHGPNFSFPDDLKDECNRAKTESRSCIESKGTKLGKERSCEVKKHLGEKKFGNMWCWMDSYWKQYIGGICSGSHIEVGCNPKTMGEVLYDVEKHEFGHYWLITVNDWGHNSIYKGCFINWRDPSKKFLFVCEDKQYMEKAIETIKQECAMAKEGELVGFNVVDKNGEMWHIDFAGTGK